MNHRCIIFTRMALCGAWLPVKLMKKLKVAL